MRCIRECVVVGLVTWSLALGSPAAAEPPPRPVHTFPDGSESCGANTSRGSHCGVHCGLHERAICVEGDPAHEGYCSCDRGPGKEPFDSRKVPKDLPPEPPKPLEAAVEKVIGPEGGSVTSVDGLFTVALPQGALAKPTKISVQRMRDPWSGVIYNLEPDGLELKKPGKVILRRPAGASPDSIEGDPATRNPDGSETLHQAEVDRQAGTKTVVIDHL